MSYGKFISTKPFIYIMQVGSKYTRFGVVQYGAKAKEVLSLRKGNNRGRVRNALRKVSHLFLFVSKQKIL